jgi:spore germination protein
MELYVVQQGDSINSIAQTYGMTVEKLMQDNGLETTYKIVTGQALVIASPNQYYTVQPEDSLQGIADSHHISLMQLLRNNPNLSGREQLFAGESLVISYPTVGSLVTNGYAYPHIRKEILSKTLPNLTYLTIFNYSITENGEISTFADETWMTELCKAYTTIPLMMISTLSQQGTRNMDLTYKILLNEDDQKHIGNEILSILKSKDYRGVNLIINFLNQDNQSLYANFIEKLSKQLKNENFLVFITINYISFLADGKIKAEPIDYSKFSNFAENLYLTKLLWGAEFGPPLPICNMQHIQSLVDFIVTKIPAEKTGISIPVLGYDWSLPYIPNRTYANSLTINAVLDLAYHVNATIQFDENSMTPFYNYSQYNLDASTEHIVWFTDARTLKAQSDLILSAKLKCSGIWNIMVYDAQLWTIMNSQFDIIK